MAAIVAWWLLGAAAWAQVAGEYYAYGRNADGSAYSGTAEILENADGTYQVTWSVGAAYYGTGVLEGRVLEVEWGDSFPSIYVLMENGDLHGTWGNGTSLEILTRNPR